MAGYYKKRRSAGPSKNEQKVARAQDAKNQLRSGALGQRFPRLSRLKMQLVFMNAQQHLLDEKTVTLGPNDAFTFTAACPGRCGQGSFDIGARVELAITKAQPACEATAKCQQHLYAGSTELCGCELRAKMEFEYLPVPA